MNRASPHPAAEEDLLSLIYELLDAHVDTVELRSQPTETLRWQAHLDYLRALHRTAEAILAHPAAPGNLTSSPTEQA